MSKKDVVQAKEGARSEAKEDASAKTTDACKSAGWSDCSIQSAALNDESFTVSHDNERFYRSSYSVRYRATAWSGACYRGGSVKSAEESDERPTSREPEERREDCRHP